MQEKTQRFDFDISLKWNDVDLKELLMFVVVLELMEIELFLCWQTIHMPA